jgi:hypothetical protein
MNKIRSGSAIICEYVAQGSHGKHTLVNVYSGDILVAELPARVPFAFFIELEFEGGGGSAQLKIEVLTGGSKAKISADASMEIEPGKPAIIVLQQAGFQIDKATNIRVRASIDGGRMLTLAQKSISQGDIPGLTVPSV